MRAVVIGASLASALADGGVHVEKLMGKAFLPASHMMPVHPGAPVAPADRAPISNFPVSNPEKSIAHLQADISKLEETNDRVKAELEGFRSQIAIMQAYAKPIDNQNWRSMMYGFGYGIGAGFLLSIIYIFFSKGNHRAPVISMSPLDGAELQPPAATALPLFSSSGGLRTAGVMSGARATRRRVLPARKRSAVRMECVDELSISREVKYVRVFDGDYASDICEDVTKVALEAIADKGSFSLAIPGGSVVAALGGLKKDGADWSKMHVFFCNEKIPSYPCIEMALTQTRKIGVPDEQVHAMGGDGSPAEMAEKYTKLLKEHPSIDKAHEAALPSFDMMLLGTGPDGHVGCVFPDGELIKAYGTGQVVMAGKDERADGDFLAISMDVMCAAKVVLVSAAGKGREKMVNTAFSGKHGVSGHVPSDCPAAMVEGREDTLWFTDTSSMSKFEKDTRGYIEQDCDYDNGQWQIESAVQCSRPSSPQPPDVLVEPTFDVGEHVELVDLSSSSFNGCVGVVEGEMKDGRYPIRIPGRGTKMLKPKNLVLDSGPPDAKKQRSDRVSHEDLFGEESA